MIKIGEAYSIPGTPKGWHFVTRIVVPDDCCGYGTVFDRPKTARAPKARVMLSVDEIECGQQWLHLSVSHPHKNPSWHTIKEVKELFMPKDKYAIQMIAPKSEHINIHEHCFHLWMRLDGPTISDEIKGRC